MFDVNLVLGNYGLSGVLFEIAFIELLNALLLRAAYADPCQLFIAFWGGKLSSRVALALLGVEFMAGYLSYLLAIAFWSVGMHSAHLEILGEKCSADLTTTILVGSAVEATGLLTAKALELVYERHVPTYSSYPAALTIASALTSGVITVAGIHVTGMYANPIVAWACTFNCGEVTYLAHFVVYWLAPLVAWVIADKMLVKAVEESEEKVASKLGSEEKKEQ